MNVMLDLETMGTENDSAIVAIGAVLFNRTKITDKFYTPISLESSLDVGLTVNASTITWWMEQSPSTKSIFSGKEIKHIKDGLKDFSNWLAEVKNWSLWGNGSTFDNIIFRNAFKACNLKQPWLYRDDMCYRTMRRAYPEIKMNRFGEHHNALDDATTQALHLIDIFKFIDNGR